MYKQLPSGRMNRSRGFKVKNVLQICVLLAVCLWLIYQVKQSHEKKQFDGNESSLSQKTGSSDGIPNLGRKYLPDSKEIANSDEKHGTYVEDNNLEEDEQEKNDEGRGGGDDDLEEHNQEKNDGEVEQEDEAVGDEKEGEEKDNSDDNNGEEQDENSEDNENDEDSGSKHEAQEVLYKADDASSAVTHDMQEVTTENENTSMEELRENAEVNVLEQAGEVNNDKEISDGQDTTLVQDRTTGHEKSEHVSNSQGTSTANVTSMEGLNGHPMERNLTETSGESNLDSTEYNNATLSGKTTAEGSNLANTTLDRSYDSASVVNNSLSDSNLATSKNEGAESTQSDSSVESNHANSSVLENVIQGHPRFTTQDDRWSATIDTSEATDAEKSGTVDETDSTAEEFESFNTENIGEIEDLIDSSDSSFSLDEKDVRNDLETLPEIQTEGSDTEDVAAK